VNADQATVGQVVRRLFRSAFFTLVKLFATSSIVAILVAPASWAALEHRILKRFSSDGH
jgi:hypothetical protein